MRYLITILIFLMIVSLADARTVVVVGGGVPVAGASYLHEEGFEGTGLPTGYTTTDGSPDYDNTTHNIVGAQSMYLTGTVSLTSATFTAQSDVYVAFRMKVVANANNNYALVCVNSGGTRLGCFGVRYNGRMTASVPGDPDIGTVSTLAVGSTYYIKFHYTAGTGNATVVVYSSTNGTNWTTEATRNDGTGGNADRLSWLTENADAYSFDDIRVSATDINW
jgi:hypothetical protein